MVRMKEAGVVNAMQMSGAQFLINKSALSRDPLS